MFRENRAWEVMLDFAQGCRAGHSREEAVMVALIASEKLMKNRILTC